MATTRSIAQSTLTTARLGTELLYRPTRNHRSSWLVLSDVAGRCEWVRLYEPDIARLEAATGYNFGRGKSISLPYPVAVALDTVIPASYNAQAQLRGISEVLS